MKRIGIIGGISYKSTLKYYELIMQKYFKKKKDTYFPEIVIFSLSFQKFADFEKHGDTLGYLQYIMQGMKVLEDSRVDFALMAANSPHAIYSEIVQRTTIPLLSIVDATVSAVKKANIKKVLLLGIKFTLQAGFYQAALEKDGVEVVIPSEDEQDTMNTIIFNELNIGIVKDESRAIILNIINNYSVDGVVIGCTVLPLILQQQHIKTKVFDTTELHTDAVVEKLLE